MSGESRIGVNGEIPKGRRIEPDMAREATALFHSTNSNMVGISIRRVGYSDAEDVAQNTWVSVLPHLDNVRDPVRYLQRATVRSALDWNRHRNVGEKRGDAPGIADTSELYDGTVGEGSLSISAEDRVMSQMRLRRVLEGITTLPDIQREVIERVASGMSYEAIANELKIPLGTVKSRTLVARRKLAELL